MRKRCQRCGVKRTIRNKYCISCAWKIKQNKKLTESHSIHKRVSFYKTAGVEEKT